MITVNAMGDACPIPVVKTKNAIRELGEAGGVVETLVDNEIAVQNLTKMANQLDRRLKEILNIKAEVKLVLPGTLERFEGKSKHVTDNRIYE